MKELDFEKVKKEYNNIMYSLCLEFNTIGTSFSENTNNWNIRDMVSECQYQYECHYEDGNGNEEGRYPDYWEITEEELLSKRKYDALIRHNDSQKEMHEYWLKRTRMLRNFIRKYSKYIDGVKCYMGHCSKYDN
jgi:hypothetical protein